MNIKQFLSKHIRLRKSMKCLEAEIIELSLRAESIGSFDYATDKVKTSQTPAATYETLIEMKVTKQKELHELTLQWLDNIKKIETALEIFPPTNQGGNMKDTLHLRYLSGLKYPDIAKTLGVSIESVYIYHRKGINYLREHYSEL